MPVHKPSVLCIIIIMQIYCHLYLSTWNTLRQLVKSPALHEVTHTVAGVKQSSLIAGSNWLSGLHFPCMQYRQ